MRFFGGLFVAIAVCLISSGTFAKPATKRQRQQQQQPLSVTAVGQESEAFEVIDGTRPSYSFYDHLIGNLQKSNRFVQLAMTPNGIPPPLDSPDYDDTPLPHAEYAFVNPALNGEHVPHWTETLEKFKANPAISPEVKDEVVHALQGPIKIYGAGTESRFPLLIEYVVQRIQNYFSHYVYQDMSRPGSWEVKVNDSAVDPKPSADKEPVNEDGKVHSQPEGAAGDGAEEEESIDYLIDITLRPDLDDLPDVELKDEDFEKTTEEWEAPKEEVVKTNSTRNTTKAEATVIVEKDKGQETTAAGPVGVEGESYFYVADEKTGETEEDDQNNARERKLRE